jgi:hypothetical protein
MCCSQFKMIYENLLADLMFHYRWGTDGLWLKDPRNMHFKCRIGRNAKDVIHKLYGGRASPEF